MLEQMQQDYKNFDPRAALMAEARAVLERAAAAAMADGSLPKADLPAFITETPADAKNGDVAANIAMAGARVWRMPPRRIAEAIAAHLDLPAWTGVFDRVEVAGPGFLNFYASLGWLTGVVYAATVREDYGRTDAAGRSATASPPALSGPGMT